MLLLPAHYVWRFFKAFEIGWLRNAGATRFKLWALNGQTATSRIHFFLSDSFFLVFVSFFSSNFHNSSQDRRITATLTNTLRMTTVRLTSSLVGTWTSETSCSSSFSSYSEILGPRWVAMRPHLLWLSWGGPNTACCYLLMLQQHQQQPHCSV